MAITKAQEFEDLADQLRDISESFLDIDAHLKDIRAFYDANTSSSAWVGWASGDEIGESGITKANFISMMTFGDNVIQFLDNVAVAADYRRTILQQVRATD